MSSTPAPNGPANTSQPDAAEKWYEAGFLIYVLVGVIVLMVAIIVAVWRKTRKRDPAIGDQWFQGLVPQPNHSQASGLTGAGAAHFYPNQSPRSTNSVKRPGMGSQDTYAAPLSVDEEDQMFYEEPGKTATYEYNDPSVLQPTSRAAPVGRGSDPTPEFTRKATSSPKPRAPPRPSLNVADAAAAEMISAAVTAPKFKMLGRALPPPPPTVDLSEQRKAILQRELEARQLMAKKQTLVKQAMHTNAKLQTAKSELLVAAQQRHAAASEAAKEQQEQRLAERERKTQALAQKKQLLLDQARDTNVRLHAAQVAHGTATLAAGLTMQAQKKALLDAAMNQNRQNRTRSVLDGYPAAPAKDPAASLEQNIAHHRASVRRSGTRGGSKRYSSHPSAELKQELVRQAYIQAQEASARSRASRFPAVVTYDTAESQPAPGEDIYDNLADTTDRSSMIEAPSATIPMLSQTAVDSAEWTNSELRKLAAILKRLGSQDGSWSASDKNAPTADVRFGDLQNAAAHEFKSLSGILFTAKKHRVVSFPATSLWPGKSDQVPITLLKDEWQIDILQRHSMRIKQEKEPF